MGKALIGFGSLLIGIDRHKLLHSMLVIIRTTSSMTDDNDPGNESWQIQGEFD
jgi:hypothetical protein